MGSPATRFRRFGVLLSCAAVCSAPSAAPPTGRIRIDCEDGVIVSLDGHGSLKTSYRTGGLLLEEVPAGLRRLKLAKPGFAPDEQRVTVVSGGMEVLAVFFWRPEIRSAPVPERPPASLLKELAMAGTAQAALRQELESTPVQLERSPSGQPELSALRKGAGADYVNHIALARHLEIEASTQFRTDYAQFQTVDQDASVPTEQKLAAWRKLALAWNVPPDEGPAALVWRRHRVELGRGLLLVRLGTDWPVHYGAPTRTLDGRELPKQPDSKSGGSTWEFPALSATAHTLRITHPAIEPAEVTVRIEDGKATSIKWTPSFKNPPVRP